MASNSTGASGDDHLLCQRESICGYQGDTLTERTLAFSSEDKFSCQVTVTVALLNNSSKGIISLSEKFRWRLLSDQDLWMSHGNQRSAGTLTQFGGRIILTQADPYYILLITFTDFSSWSSLMLQKTRSCLEL